MKRLKNILNEDYEIEDSDETDHTIDKVSGNIEFSNVTFRYRDDLPDVLDDVSLKIPLGTTLAIVGHTGEGKTSFINLVSRMFDITSGKIMIDGHDIKTIPVKVLREDIGLVSQETFLFSDTLANNIAYGMKEFDEDKVKKMAAIARLDKDVESFPDKYDTILGERGITLSGGQKQRTCLARALAIEPNILILDDTFSAVDTRTEEEILERLKDFMKERTTIIISHRISTVKDADNIIVISDSKIAEQGTHDELVSLKGIYADLHYKQLLEEELKEMN
jgi:ATP-binding cassette subfamily B protein